MSVKKTGRYFFANLMMFYCLIVNGQVTFNKTYDFSNGDEGSLSVVVVDEGYIIVGNGWGYETAEYFDSKLKYCKIDWAGNLIWQKHIGIDFESFYDYFLSTIKTLDGNIVVSGYHIYPAAANRHTFLLKFNPATGDTILYREYPNDHQTGLQVREFSNGDLLISVYDSDDPVAGYFIKTDAAGNFIWEKGYGTDGQGNTIDFKINEDDTYYVLNRYNFCSPPGYFLKQFNSSGVEIWSSTFYEECAGHAVLSIMGGFVGSGVNYPDLPFNAFTYRANEAGEILWKYATTWDYDTISDNELYTGDFEELSNGDLLITGYYAYYDGGYRGFVSKVNIDGVPYWERAYTAQQLFPDMDNRLHDIAVCPDGGIIISGAAYSNDLSEDQNFWALKLDSMGCLTPGCDTLDVAMMELPFNDEIVMFPNPAKDFFIIQSGSHFANDALVQVLTMAGQLVEEHTIPKGANALTLHVNHYENGVYLIKVTDGQSRSFVQKLIVNK